jgi:catechol 2,3-dioxygenase-like lactoylglutathione lyase family enzyme
MKFRSNRCVAIHLPSLAKAERFYSDILGFTRKRKSRTCLEYDTGELGLYVNRAKVSQPTTACFRVQSIIRGWQLLRDAGGEIVTDRGPSLYFRDPFGNLFDGVEG